MITDKIHQWNGYSEISGGRLHAYGMGAAITNCIQGSNFSIHNQVVPADTLLQDAGKAVAKIVKLPEELRMLAEKLRSRNSSEYLGLERSLDRVYGPPVYARVLAKFKLDYLRICGYGLRYGAYAWQYHRGCSLAKLTEPC